MGRICVIMSLHNGVNAAFLEQSINSVLEQTYNNFDLFIQYDGVIQKECDNVISNIADKRIKIFKRKNNLGLAASLNELIGKAKVEKYPFIARMDADDISSPIRFEKQIEFLQSNSDVELVGSWAKIIDQDSLLIGEKKVKTQFEFGDLINSCEIIHPSTMFRISFFKKVGLYDPKLLKSQDYDLWLRASILGISMLNMPEFLISLRYEPDIVKRRKYEQKYNILIKKKHVTGVRLLLSLVKNYIVIILPEFILRRILYYAVKI